MGTGKPKRPSTTTYRRTELWSRRAQRLFLPVLGVQRAAEGAPHWYQLLWSTGRASGMHQRCEEHEQIPQRVLWLQERGYGYFDG